MKKILILLVALSSSLVAFATEESNQMEAIVELFREGKTEEGNEKLKELDPGSYKAIAGLIDRVIKQEKKVYALERDLEVQKQFHQALSARLAQETERVLTPKTN